MAQVHYEYFKVNQEAQGAGAGFDPREDPHRAKNGAAPLATSRPAGAVLFQYR